MLFNTIVEPEGAEAGGHRHALFCIPVFADRYHVTVQAPRFTHEHLRDVYLRNFPHVHIAPTPAGNTLAANRGLALLLRSVTCIFVPKAEVYYASSGFLPDTIGPAIRRMFKPSTKMVVVVHHLVDMEKRRAAGEGNVLAQWFERLSLWIVRRFATGVIAGNEFVREQLVEQGIPRSRIVVTTNGVQYRVSDDEDALREREVLFIGRVSLRKGIGDLCRAWAAVASEYGDWKLTLVGAMEPRDAAVLEPLIDSNPTIRYAGRVPEPELAAELKRASVFVMPSYEEGWCIAIAEAMACGLPVISYALPIFDLSFTAGRIAVPVGDVHGLADALRELVGNAAHRKALASQALNVSKRFDWNVAARIELGAFASST